MRFFDGDALLANERAWLEEIADRTRMCARAVPDVDEDFRRRFRMMLFHAWRRYRIPWTIGVLANWTAVGGVWLLMIAVCAAAGLVAMSLAHGGYAAGAPGWLLFQAAPLPTLCLGMAVVLRRAIRRSIAWIRAPRPGSPERRIPTGTLSDWLLPAAVLSLVALFAGSSWYTTRVTLRTAFGIQEIVAAEALFGLTVSLSGRRWIRILERRIGRALRGEKMPYPLDGVFVELTWAAWFCSAPYFHWVKAREVRTARQLVGVAARAAADTTSIARRTKWVESATRRRAEGFSTALAEIISRHDLALAQMRTARQAEAVASSLWAGCVALAVGDLEALMQNARPTHLSSRVGRILRRIAPSFVLVLFALAIPALPGVDERAADGVRVLLLMTAALAVTPADDAASASIRSALDRALFPKAGA